MSRSVNPDFVASFRQSSPYIRAHAGRTFVLCISGKVATDHQQLDSLAKDITLLVSLGVRLVLCYGTRPEIERRLQLAQCQLRYENGLRVTDDAALECVRDAAASVRVALEARLSQGLANAPDAQAPLRVVSGNLVTAKPLGVLDGVDYQHTGEVRKVDIEGISRLLADYVVLLSPLGYSSTGELFNLTAREVATAAACALRADKLIFMHQGAALQDVDGQPLAQIETSQHTLAELQTHNADQQPLLKHAWQACAGGVRRVHVLRSREDGALLSELYTRDGIGSLIYADHYDQVREANIADVGGLLEIIQPLEQQAVLVSRSREQLELEISRFSVLERDGMIIGCAGLYPLGGHHGELAGLAIHPDYQGTQRGEQLLNHIEQRARHQGLQHLVVLTTRAIHWFQERGFAPITVEQLPAERAQAYNLQRQSRVLRKML